MLGGETGRRLAGVALTVWLGCLTGAGAHADYAATGIDSRPPNAACVAGARPEGTGSLYAERAYSALDFRTLPANSHPEYRNGVIDMAKVPDDPNYWFVVERAGRIHRVAGNPTATSFTTALDISGMLGSYYFEQLYPSSSIQ